MGEEQTEGKPKEPLRRKLFRGALGVAVGAAGGELVRKLIPEQEDEKEVIRLPAIVGLVYRRNPAHPDREVGYFPDAGDEPVPGEEIILDKFDEREPDGKKQAGTARSNKEGVYVFPGLEPGDYQIGVSPRYQPGKQFATQGPSMRISVTPDTTILVGPIIGKLN